MSEEQYEDEINLWELLIVIAKRKSLIIRITVAVFIFAVVYSLIATPVYKVSTTLMAKGENKSAVSSLGGLSGLASLAGVNLSSLGGGNSLDNIVLTLNSSDFIFYFNKKYKIMEKYFEMPKDEITEDAILSTIKNVFSTDKNDKDATLTISVVYREPEKAYEIMQLLLKALNEFIVKREMNESNKLANVLKDKIKTTHDPILKAEFTKMLANEVKKGIYAQINENSLYKIISSPFIPNKRISPKRKLIVIIAIILGLFLGIFLAFVLEFFENIKKDPENGHYYQQFMDYLGIDKIKGKLRRKR